MSLARNILVSMVADRRFNRACLRKVSGGCSNFVFGLYATYDYDILI